MAHSSQRKILFSSPFLFFSSKFIHFLSTFFYSLCVFFIVLLLNVVFGWNANFGEVDLSRDNFRKFVRGLSEAFGTVIRFNCEWWFCVWPQTFAKRSRELNFLLLMYFRIKFIYAFHKYNFDETTKRNILKQNLF